MTQLCLPLKELSQCPAYALITQQGYLFLLIQQCMVPFFCTCTIMTIYKTSAAEKA